MDSLMPKHVRCAVSVSVTKHEPHPPICSRLKKKFSCQKETHNFVFCAKHRRSRPAKRKTFCSFFFRFQILFALQQDRGHGVACVFNYVTPSPRICLFARGANRRQQVAAQPRVRTLPIGIQYVSWVEPKNWWGSWQEARRNLTKLNKLIGQKLHLSSTQDDLGRLKIGKMIMKIRNYWSNWRSL